MAKTSLPVEGFLLAGGESSRMGRDKVLLDLGGLPLIVRMERLVQKVAGKPTAIGRPEVMQPLGVRAVRDEWPGAGPLGGIATGLRLLEESWALIVACDLPFLTEEWLKFLVDSAISSTADAILPMNEGGPEPLCAMYHKRCESVVWLSLDRGIRKVTSGLVGLSVEFIERQRWKDFDSGGLLFKNMNSPEDYEEAKARFAERKG
jgi:molybdopterin-guanine dinucleotide biosynthesis protein A